MPRPRPPFLHKQVTQHGRTVWYVRRGKGARVRLRAAFGTPEFTAEYEAALCGEAVKPTRATAGTLAWLVDRYRETVAWARLSAATRRQRENIFKHVLAQGGEAPVSKIARKQIVAGIDRRRATPAAARHFLETMRGLFQWALDAELVSADPTMGVKAPKKTGDGFHSWSEEEVERFEERWPIGTRERVAFAIFLWTGLRRGDAAKFGRQHVRNGIASVRTEKTGEVVTFRLLPPLLEVLDAGPCGDLAFIVGERGEPMTKESLGNWFRKACRAAGVPGAAHGLRKAGATRAANAGATEHELMSLYGWAEPRTAAIYTRKANRERLSMQASDKVELARNANIYSPTGALGEGSKTKKS